MAASFLALPKLAEALVGRMAIKTLYPFAAAEYKQTTPPDFFADDFIDALIQDSTASDELLDMIHHSTFPEIALNDRANRREWFEGYLATILQRDVRALSDLKNPQQMVAFLSLLAIRTGSMANLTAISRELGIDFKTTEKMLMLAMNAFIIMLLQPWAQPNRLNKRFVKMPKVYFLDTNFLAFLFKQDLATVYQQDQAFWGHFLENFVATELVKLASWQGWDLTYFRTTAGKEVDFVVENGNALVGIEVKSAATVSNRLISGLQELKAISGKRFKRGIVLYLGKKVESLGDNCWAVPLSAFWQDPKKA